MQGLKRTRVIYLIARPIFKGVWFFFSMLSHTKLSVVQKNRKEGQILTVFFSLGIQPEKKTVTKKSQFFSQTSSFFCPFWGQSSILVYVFFFSGSESRGKKKPVKSGSGEEGRRTYVITWKNKNHTPLVVSYIFHAHTFQFSRM